MKRAILLFFVLVLMSSGFVFSASNANVETHYNNGVSYYRFDEPSEPEEYTVVAPYEDVKCGDYLYYDTNLTYDLNCNSTQDGLNLNANGITLDCKGHTIKGNCSIAYNTSTYWSWGVWVMNNNGNSIVNCTIKNFC